MGQKTHPIGFRLGTTRDWVSHWFGVNPKDYRVQVLEDHKIREHINNDLGDSSGISHIQIQRNSEDLAININTSRPGIVIGRGGSNVDKLRNSIEKITSKKANISITEIRQPDLNAKLVAQNIAEQIERRVAIKRAMRQVGNRCIQNGANNEKQSVPKDSKKSPAAPIREILETPNSEPTESNQPETKKPTANKPTAKKTTAKKPTAKKTTVKKPTAKKTVSKKSDSEK